MSDGNSDIREARVLIDDAGTLRRLCKLYFTKKDASIYITPYAPSGTFVYGDSSFAENVVQSTFGQRSGNNHALDFTTALPDSVYSNFAVEAFDRIVATITPATPNL